MSKKEIGKGVEGLFDSIKITKNKKDKNTTSNSGVININVDHIIENSHQPRTHFNDEALIGLSISIKENGLLQPITVIKKDEDKYELIAGERRLRASKLAGLTEIPAIIKEEVDQNKKSVLALIENIQREDLNPIEIAVHLQRMIEDFKYTHETISKKLGIGRSNVSNYLRILNLPEETRELISTEKISMGHAKLLVSIKDSDLINQLANDVVGKNLSVSKLSKLIKSLNEKTEDNNDEKENDETIYEDLTIIEDLDKIKDKYKIKCQKKKLTFSFENEEEIKKFIKLLS